MSENQHFAALTVATAVAASQRLLAASERQFGFVPDPVARAAHSPALLKHMLAGFVAFDESSLSAVEREVVALTVAFERECEYCMALHSALVSRTEAAPHLQALRAGSPLSDPRLEALRVLARSVLRQHGRVSEPDWLAFEAAGYDRRNALDVALGVGVYWLSTLSNAFTQTQLDPAFEAFRWAKPPVG